MKIHFRAVLFHLEFASKVRGTETGESEGHKKRKERLGEAQERCAVGLFY